MRALNIAAALALSASYAQTAPQPARALSAREVYRKASPSILKIISFGAQATKIGSGIAIEEGVAITNYHVLDVGSQYEVQAGGRRLPATALFCERAVDLCVLSVPGLTASPLPHRTFADLEIGERVYAIGSPEGLASTLSEGLISGKRLVGEQPFLQTSAPISHGSSGGGLFDDRARLVGITAASLEEGQNLNFAIPTDALRAFLNRAGLNILVEKNLKAIGGREAIAAIDTLRFEGHAQTGDLILPLVIEWKRPDLYRMDMWVESSPILTQAYDGESVWVRDSKGLRTQGDVNPEDRWLILDQARHFVDPIDRDGRLDVEFLGIRQTAGKSTYRLRLREEGGGERLIDLDAHTYREVREIRKHIVNGRRVTFTTILGEYTPVRGVVFPASVSATIEGGDRRVPSTVTLRITRMEGNVPLAESRFAP